MGTHIKINWDAHWEYPGSCIGDTLDESVQLADWRRNGYPPRSMHWFLLDWPDNKSNSSSSDQKLCLGRTRILVLQWLASEIFATGTVFVAPFVSLLICLSSFQAASFPGCMSLHRNLGNCLIWRVPIHQSTSVLLTLRLEWAGSSGVLSRGVCSSSTWRCNEAGILCMQRTCPARKLPSPHPSVAPLV